MTTDATPNADPPPPQPKWVGPAAYAGIAGVAGWLVYSAANRIGAADGEVGRLGSGMLSGNQQILGVEGVDDLCCGG